MYFLIQISDFNTASDCMSVSKVLGIQKMCTQMNSNAIIVIKPQSEKPCDQKLVFDLASIVNIMNITSNYSVLLHYLRVIRGNKHNSCGLIWGTRINRCCWECTRARGSACWGPGADGFLADVEVVSSVFHV